jgi:N utilization substance protein B
MKGVPLRAGGGRRRAARLAAVQALYQIELAQADPELTIAEFIRHRLGKKVENEPARPADANWFADLVRGTSARQAEIDAALNAALAKDRRVDRLEAILRAIVRAGAYEVLIRTDVPPRSAINEYVDLANAFFSGTEPRLVNGVLDKVAQRHRAADMARATASGDAKAG